MKTVQEVIGNIPRKYKFIVRNSMGGEYAFVSKPVLNLNMGIWCSKTWGDKTTTAFYVGKNTVVFDRNAPYEQCILEIDQLQNNSL